MPTEISALLTEVDAREEELVELLSRFVRFETPAPPARNTAAAQDFMAGYLRDLGFEVDQWDVYPGDPNVVGVRKGPGAERFKSLIINGHMDVAEVNPDEAWRTGPFEPFLENGMLFGRGTADMKGGLAGALFALRLLRDHEIDLPGELIFQSVIGEEVGEAGTLQCCERGYTADFALVVDTSELHIQGQGGVITGWIELKSPQTFHDAMRRRMVHAGGGVSGANTIEKMAKIIQGLNELERHWAVMKSYPGCPAGTTTINPAVIEGGRHAAFVPDECRLWVTVHFYPNETHEQITREIERHVLAIAEADPWMRENKPSFIWGGRSMIVDRGEIFPSLELDAAHPAVGMLATTHNKALGMPATLDVSSTVTDGGWFGAAGIPAAIYGPGELRHAHAIDERVSMAQMKSFTKSIILFVHEWLNTPR